MRKAYSTYLPLTRIKVVGMVGGWSGSVILFEVIGVADRLNQTLDCATQFGLHEGLQAF